MYNTTQYFSVTRYFSVTLTVLMYHESLKVLVTRYLLV